MVKSAAQKGNSMSEIPIICPTCNTRIRLTEALAAPLVASIRRDCDVRLAEKDTVVAREIEALRERSKELSKVETAAKSNEASLLLRERKIDEQQTKLDLSVQKGVEKGLLAVRDQARRETAEEKNLQLAERDNKITSLTKQLENAKQTAEQGSQQIQGDVQEVDIALKLQNAFERDYIERVKTGKRGADIIHHVRGMTGQRIGMILWESRRRKDFKTDWLPTLRQKQREAKAEIAVIVSRVLPKGVETFALLDGIWITHPRFLLPVAVILRHLLVEIASVRQISVGQQSKGEKVYEYVTGPQFRHRLQGSVEAIGFMQEGLDKARTFFTQHCAKTEIQIQQAMEGLASMFGDLQGITGESLQDIGGLDFKALTTGKQSSTESERHIERLEKKQNGDE